MLGTLDTKIGYPSKKICHKTNTMKDPLYFVTHKMFPKREKKEREAKDLFYFFSFKHVPIII